MQEAGELGAVSRALEFMQDTLLGSAATSIAIIAIAALGFMLLTGRVDVRRAARVVIGCFIIFGAATVGATLYQLSAKTSPTAPVSQPSPLSPEPLPPPASNMVYDPYAGASVPQQ